MAVMASIKSDALDSPKAKRPPGRRGFGAPRSDTLGQAALTHAQITQAITWRTLQQKDDENESDEDEDTNPAH